MAGRTQRNTHGHTSNNSCQPVSAVHLITTGRNHCCRSTEAQVSSQSQQNKRYHTSTVNFYQFVRVGQLSGDRTGHTHTLAQGVWAIRYACKSKHPSPQGPLSQDPPHNPCSTTVNHSVSKCTCHLATPPLGRAAAHTTPCHQRLLAHSTTDTIIPGCQLIDHGEASNNKNPTFSSATPAPSRALNIIPEASPHRLTAARLQPNQPDCCQHPGLYSPCCPHSQHCPVTQTNAASASWRDRGHLQPCCC